MHHTIGSVLMQEGHSLAYDPQKLKEVEVRYKTYEKEKTAAVHCLEI